MNANSPAVYLGLLLSLLLAPLLSGIINRVKAVMAGRRGRPLLQLYFDLHKLLGKSPVYSVTSSWFFRAAPAAGLAAALAGLCLLPFGPLGSIFSFSGDFLLLAGLFALARFSLILAALDTGSAFEGMGAAREALFSALAEPIFLFCLMALAQHSHQLSLAGMTGGTSRELWLADWPFYLMIALALFLLLLPENCRIPVDDPNTHLELTMIHEVMILDHSGPDLALLEYASALKLWMFGLLIANVLTPVSGLNAPAESVLNVLTATGYHGFPFIPPRAGAGPALAGLGLTLALVFVLAALVGLVESLMARFRMERVPQILTLAGSFVCLAALTLWRLAR